MAPPNPPPNTTTTLGDPTLSSSGATSTAPPTVVDRRAQYRQLIHYTSISALLLCPTLLLLPPRKLDIYTVLLLSSTGLAANQVVREHTGRSLVERVRDMRRAAAAARRAADEDADARRNDAAWVSERATGDASKLGGGVARMRDGDGSGLERGGPTTAAVRRAAKEREDWKVKRDAREREALEDGRGYGGLITDQIWEVWNWGRERKGEAGEEAVNERKDGKS